MNLWRNSAKSRAVRCFTTNDYTDADKAIVGGVTSALEGKVDKVAGKGLSTNDYTTTEKNKLAGISANAKNVAISDTLQSGDTIANITIDGTTTAIKATQVTVDSALSTSSENPVQNKVITAELNGIEGAMEESMSGNPIIAECANLPAKELSVALEPIQDLHGYDYPWVGGANINLLPPNATDGITTLNGVTCKAENGVYTLSGTASIGTQFTFTLKDTVNLSPSTKKICFLNSKAQTSGEVSVYFCRGNDTIHYWQMNP